MKFAKWAKTAFCAAFMLMLVLPLVFTNFRPGVVSAIENRTLRPFPALFGGDGERNKNFNPEFESWFNDHVGFREEMFTANAALQYNLFHSSTNSGVVTGRDGWLFYTGDNNLEIAAGEYPNFDENILADICRKQQYIQRALAAQGIEYVIILPSSKVSIYPEYLRGDFEIRKTPVDTLADYLEENSSLKVVRLKQALLENKEANGELLYYQTDTHWNAYGTYVAYCEIVRRLNEWGIIESGPVEADFVEEAVLRDLTRMIVGDDEQHCESGITAVNIRAPQAAEVTEGEKYADISSYVADKDLLCADYYLNSNTSLPVFLATR